MPNKFFQFKQFTVHQENAALKVSTDSCLFGAWIAREIRNTKYDVRKALDVGAGTGLLMLMLAQQSVVFIDGIEIDEPSYLDAKRNIEASAWSNRLKVLLDDAKQMELGMKYDLIISNPPFYEGDLKSDAGNRNVAMHDTGLKLNELIQVVDKNLHEDGLFAVLLPYHRTDFFVTDAADKNLYLLKRVDVKQTINHSFFRTMLLLGRKISKTETSSVTIKNDSNEYTDAFVELLKEYYLYL